MSIRLSKIAKELNVGVSTAVEFLSKKGFNVDGDNSNYKLTDEEENLLRMEFDKGLHTQPEPGEDITVYIEPEDILLLTD